jgi:hypothetical protein
VVWHLLKVFRMIIIQIYGRSFFKIINALRDSREKRNAMMQ